MREIGGGQRVASLTVCFTWWGLAAACAYIVARNIPTLGSFSKGGVFLLAYVGIGILFYRVLRAFFPLPSGEIGPDSAAEWVHNVCHIPFMLFLYFPVAFSCLVPAPLTRLWARLWGMKIGANSYPGCAALGDPQFISVGRDVIFGFHSVLTAHMMEGARLAHYPIRVGDRVTIGVNAVLLPGVTVGDGATVASGAVVPKFTHIGAGEVWGGIPARKIRDAVSPLPTKFPDTHRVDRAASELAKGAL